MDIVKKDQEQLRLEMQDGRPVMKMESKGTKLIFCFASEPPVLDAKKTIVDILTSQYIGKSAK